MYTFILRRFYRFGFLFSAILLLLQAQKICATEISRSLNAYAMDQYVRGLAFAAAHKPWTAASIPNNELGLDLGLETVFVPRDDLLGLGDGTAVIPKIIPVPRLWGSWDLPAEFRISGSFAPSEIYDGIGAYGGGLQWKWWDDEDYRLKLSSVLNYTYINAFGDMFSHVFDLTQQVSRDLELWQPYAGFGFLYGNSSFLPSLVQNNEKKSGRNLFALHSYLGARIELPTRLYFQADFINTSVTGSIMLSASF